MHAKPPVIGCNVHFCVYPEFTVRAHVPEQLDTQTCSYAYNDQERLITIRISSYDLQAYCRGTITVEWLMKIESVIRRLIGIRVLMALKSSSHQHCFDLSLPCVKDR